ncbi:hypothetical protein [Streptomyces sp. NPDC093261]|uniref:hypothetical protein n=1 Tax=Streptomyces sp. NPDC093261 TaxID=3366037 RepID=UPI0037FA4E1F
MTTPLIDQIELIAEAGDPEDLRELVRDLSRSGIQADVQLAIDLRRAIKGDQMDRDKLRAKAGDLKDANARAQVQFDRLLAQFPPAVVQRLAFGPKH